MRANLGFQEFQVRPCSTYYEGFPVDFLNGCRRLGAVLHAVGLVETEAFSSSVICPVAVTNSRSIALPSNPFSVSNLFNSSIAKFGQTPLDSKYLRS